MEGVGSTRLGRSSARYGPTTVFNGPVRRWKKKWVHVSPPSAAKHQNSKSRGHTGNSKIVLCRWTPLPSSDSSVAGDGCAAEEPPKRKFRYTPVAVLEDERKRAFAKPLTDDGKTDEANQPSDWLSSKGSKANMDEDFMHDTQDSNLGLLELGLGLKG